MASTSGRLNEARSLKWYVAVAPPPIMGTVLTLFSQLTLNFQATRVVDAEQTRILPAAGLVRTAWTIEEDRVLAGRYRDAGLDDNFGREDEAELLNLRRLLP